MKPSRLESTVRWMLLIAWVAGSDTAATNWTLAASKRLPVIVLANGEGRRTSYRGYDGSQVFVYRESMTGKKTIEAGRPPTVTGLCYVWWPSVAGGIITLLALALAATRNGRRLIGERPLLRMTTRRLMIAVAVVGIEAALIINVATNLGRVPWDFRKRARPSPWPPILICLAAPPTLVFLSAFGRTPSVADEKNSSEHNQ
jgi:hypothetical protein